ncbi:hypothetical protein [Streptomyces sp. R08]|uniref:Uncharacterized protein n=1 Tax=Streptomyces sp. R08 TaxID=3238624 RepID=A0AB39M0I9_9ACTN
MADDTVASASRNRLTKNPGAKPTRVAQLAQALLKDERRMGSWHRRNGARLIGAGPLDRMWDMVRALRDGFLGRTRGAYGGGQEAGSGSGGGQSGAPDEGGRGQVQVQAPAFKVPYMSSSEMSAFERLGRLEATVRNLPVREQEAFEDEILRLIGEDAAPNKWKTAYEKSPERMPAVTRYANNAYMRKLRQEGPPDIDPETQRLRDLWERPASPRESPAPETSFQDPSRARLSDGNAFLAARRREEPGPGPSAPGSHVSDASFDVSPVLTPAALAIINDFPRPEGFSGTRDPASPSRPPRPVPANGNGTGPSRMRL